ncbi:5-oxoprolinase subunit PxpB [Bordetella sp. LUAb4]|uniref:5-oxoprolinase subunit PxpB n=1 Tax=Bordetella sp. LUAb4 TaxID=2843195 RepID=UPI001E380190|nr:5-oxoprolinase subunit PxpB [Bordetella sp. LUAb4]
MNSSPDATASSSWRIEPVGDRCLLVAFGDRVDADVNRTVLSFTAWMLEHPLPGVVDVVPAFTTVALHYRPEAYAGSASTAMPFEQLAAQVQAVLARGVPEVELGGRTVEIPCCYGGEYGPDLEEVAQRCNLSTDEVIRLHGESPLVIYTFYFAPGNPFAGGLDERLALPRRQTPRTQVPAGSVAIANGLSTIYQLAMPGGWNLIGRTPWNLFDLKQDPPVRLQLGDRLRFVPVTPAEFDRLYEARA